MEKFEIDVIDGIPCIRIDGKWKRVEFASKAQKLLKEFNHPKCIKDPSVECEGPIPEECKDYFTIEVYLDDGRVYYYGVSGHDKVREHMDAIAKGGYRHNDGKVLEHYPPHRIMKIKCEDYIPTKYTDKVKGT